MSKIDINNEIVLMRHTMRKARLHIVRKLIKQVKMLGSKKGDDKQREKYKRKSEKLGQELAAIKKIRDDEISRYSITNSTNLKDVLADQKSDPETCVLARLSSHKLVMDRVAEFKTKFPNFEQHLGPGRRKLMKLKRKAGKQAKKDAKATALASGQEETENHDVEENRMSDDTDSEEISKEIDQDSTEDDERGEDPEPELPEKAINSKRKVEDSSLQNKRVKTDPKSSLELKPKEIKSRKPVKKLDKLAGISSTSKEAAVKSFASFLEENDGEIVEPENPENERLKNENEVVLEKEVDSFFMTEDGQGEYLSVVVPKSNITEDDQDGAENEREGRNGEEFRSFKSRNNRFFDKVDNGFDVRRQNDRRDNNSNFSRGRGGGGGRGGKFNNRNESRDKNDARKPFKNRGDFGSLEKSTNENMHPSWAAKKKQQEVLKLGFQGKKIVFDDV